MTDKIYLGKLKYDLPGDAMRGEAIYLNKHKWDCEWYWGFGYIGNRNCHFHIESLIGGRLHTPKDLFESTHFTEKQWWVVRDLFIQAYALQKAAEVYRYGGHQTSVEGTTDIIKNADKAAILNADLKIVLDKVWEFIAATKTLAE